MKNRLSIMIALSLGLLLLLPLTFASTLTWQEYLRLFVITAGLGYFCWRRRVLSGAGEGSLDRTLSILLALAFMLTVTQFDPGRAVSKEVSLQGAKGGFFLAPGILVAVAFTGFAFASRFWRSGLSLLDWAVIGAALLAIGIVLGTGLILKGSLSWISGSRFAVCLMFWFLFTRWTTSGAGLQKHLLAGVLSVFCVVCLVGGARAGTAYYHCWTGDRDRKQGNDEAALAHYARAEALGRDLRLEGLRDAAVFSRAGILFRRGNERTAAETLGMEDGFIKRVRPENWEGPAGGSLYTHISCWKDLELYAGQVEVRIFAGGQPALNVWPRMRVKLGHTFLGDVDVTSGDLKSYVFRTGVETGRQRLEISFRNDYYQLPEDRNLWVDRAEVHYQEISWR